MPSCLFPINVFLILHFDSSHLLNGAKYFCIVSSSFFLFFCLVFNANYVYSSCFEITCFDMELIKKYCAHKLLCHILTDRYSCSLKNLSNIFQITIINTRKTKKKKKKFKKNNKKTERCKIKLSIKLMM